MSEQWELFLNKAGQNISISKSLFKDGFYGQAAYHAQQTIELSIKSYALKFKLLDVLKSKSLFKTHLPSKLLLKEIYKKFIEDFNHIKTRDLDPLIEENIQTSIRLLNQIVKLMKAADKDPSLLEDLWKLSLGIPSTDDSKIKKYAEEVEKVRNKKIPFALVESTVMYMRRKYSEILEDAKRARKTHLIPSITKEFKKMIEEKGIPPEVFEFYFQNTSGEMLAKQVKHSIEISESLDMFELYYGKNGILEEMKKITPKMKNDDFDYKRLSRLIFLTSLNETVLLSLPHEVYGRYSGIIDEKNTEDLYDEHSKDVQLIMNQCEKGFLDLAKFLKKPVDQSKFSSLPN